MRHLTLAATTMSERSARRRWPLAWAALLASALAGAAATAQPQASGAAPSPARQGMAAAQPVPAGAEAAVRGASRPQAPQARDGKAQAETLAGAAQALLKAVGDPSLASACGRGPKPKLGTADRNTVRLARAGALRLAPSLAAPVGPVPDVCEPHDQQLLRAGIHMLAAVGALAERDPRLVPALALQPASPGERQQLERGLAITLQALGTPSPGQTPGKP